MISSYALIIFKSLKIGSWIHPFGLILLAVAHTCGSLTTNYLVDKFGRNCKQKLNLISLLGSALALFITAFYHYLNINGFNLSEWFWWIPILSLAFGIFVSSVGIIPLSLVCGVEILPTKVSGKSKKKKFLKNFRQNYWIFCFHFSFVQLVWR